MAVNLLVRGFSSKKNQSKTFLAILWDIFRVSEENSQKVSKEIIR